MKRLEGKVAIVTGGGGGIGSATALRLVQEGARVVCADINLAAAERAVEALAGNGLAIEFDAADIGSIEAMVARTVAHYGRLDILHNNTAVTDPETQQYDRTAVDIPMDVWQKTLDVNLTGYLACCRFAIPHMIAGGGGSIINTASGSGMRGDLVRIAYGSTKAGVIAMSKYIATQHGRQGIRCNAIAPGVIVTPALERTAPEIKAVIGKYTLTPRLGTPEDIAALVAYLAADESGYITGQCIEINGGTSACQPHFAEFYAQSQQQ
ncbi:MAG: SDR family oxidoreductase [Porticoccaceae bacterium]|jgi:NAD(P)-dependent dehydrogenase (short-subunit alcohol dehydrogenase family)|nr:SDR family oxidoreductase [Porticoccaceae bacterium]MEA3300963.1 SDR family oxidoreductase [Pseudomonadota bacterium]HLS98374.1 SDR family oxidoreductase [Porticoccaceae bacterium]